MTSTMKRAFITAFSSILALACVLALAGCGQSPQSKTEEATDALESVLEQFKSGDLSEYMAEVQTFDLDEYGIDVDEVIQTVADNFSYEINGAEEDSDGNVTVDVSITSKQIVPAVTYAFQNVYQELMSTAMSATSMTDVDAFQAQFMERYGQILKEQLSSEAPTTTDLSIVMAETNGTWQPEYASSSELSNAIIGDYSTLYDNLASLYAAQ